MILPIQTVILPGLSEKKRTNAKKMAEKMRSAMGSRGSVRQHRGHAGRKGRGRASRDRKQGTDGEIQKTREEHAVALADLAR